MQSTPHPSRSTSGPQDEAPQGSNVLPLRRTPVWSERLSPIVAPQQRSVPVPEPQPGAASADATTPRGSDEPAWRQAFTAPNGVRFTRTPDRIQRERMLGASNAGVSEDNGDDDTAGFWHELRSARWRLGRRSPCPLQRSAGPHLSPTDWCD